MYKSLNGPIHTHLSNTQTYRCNDTEAILFCPNDHHATCSLYDNECIEFSLSCHACVCMWIQGHKTRVYGGVQQLWPAVIRHPKPLHILTWISKAIDFIYRNGSFHYNSTQNRACGGMQNEPGNQIRLSCIKTQNVTPCCDCDVEAPLISARSIIMYGVKRVGLRPRAML